MEGTKTKPDNRQRMRESNRRVRAWLLDRHFDQIFFKAHTKRQDLIYSQRGNYYAVDLWNLFDGMCFDEIKNLVFFQIKTNAWAREKPIIDFCARYGLCAISFNVKKDSGKWSVLRRHY